MIPEPVIAALRSPAGQAELARSARKRAREIYNLPEKPGIYDRRNTHTRESYTTEGGWPVLSWSMTAKAIDYLIFTHAAGITGPMLCPPPSPFGTYPDIDE